MNNNTLTKRQRQRQDLKKFLYTHFSIGSYLFDDIAADKYNRAVKYYRLWKNGTDINIIFSELQKEFKSILDVSTLKMKETVKKEVLPNIETTKDNNVQQNEKNNNTQQTMKNDMVELPTQIIEKKENIKKINIRSAKSRKIPVSVLLDTEMIQSLNELAEKEERKVSELIRLAIKQYLKSNQ